MIYAYHTVATAYRVLDTMHGNTIRFSNNGRRKYCGSKRLCKESKKVKKNENDEKWGERTRQATRKKKMNIKTNRVKKGFDGMG